MIAGLALAGSLLVGLVLAKVRYERQWDEARGRIAAAAAADGLLAHWWTDPDGVPVDDDGAVGAELARGDEGRTDDASRHLVWRTTALPNEAVEALGGRVVRLEVLDERGSDRVLASVELVLSAPAAASGGGP